MNKISCCYNCGTRALGCHGKCEQYQTESAKRAEAVEAHRKDKLAQATLREGYTKRHNEYVKRGVTTKFG